MRARVRARVCVCAGVFVEPMYNATPAAASKTHVSAVGWLQLR